MSRTQPETNPNCECVLFGPVLASPSLIISADRDIPFSGWIVWLSSQHTANVTRLHWRRSKPSWIEVEADKLILWRGRNRRQQRIAVMLRLWQWGIGGDNYTDYDEFALGEALG